MILRTLKYHLYSFIRNVSGWIYDSSQYALISGLKKRTNFHLSPSFTLGKYSEIIVRGENNTLYFGDRFRCKRFCNFVLYPDAKLKINNGVFMNNYCSISCLGEIEIGENTLFGEGVKLYDHNHAYSKNDGLIKVFPDDYSIGSIKIGKNCWIGSNVTILKNVVIGDNVIIGANCLIYQSVPPNSIVKSVSSLEIISSS